MFKFSACTLKRIVEVYLLIELCIRKSSIRNEDNLMYDTLEESRVLISCLHVQQSSFQSVMKTICELLMFKNMNKINRIVSLHFP